MRLCLKGKTVVLVTYLIIQNKLWKLSNYTARFTFRRQEMLMCSRGAGKHANSYSTWYQNKDETNLCVAMMKRNWFFFSLSETSNRP